jgi:NAD(P)-dependent dehydrogenase (short-subunit alcohol dehydrogenase family)
VSAAGASAPGTPQLVGQTVLVIGGSAGIGPAMAKRARAEGAEVILTGRNPEHLAAAAEEVGARSTAAFDAEDDAALERFFAELDGPVDQVIVTAGSPYYAPLDEIDFAKGRKGVLGDGLEAPPGTARDASDRPRHRPRRRRRIGDPADDEHRPDRRDL